MAKSALRQLECLIQDGSNFELSPNLEFLADTERTLFAARVGAGITDLYMNSLGYTWRANAGCLSSTLNPHADYIYEGGNVRGHGVVLAEAHGSFAANASASSVANQCKRKYRRQVKPYVGKGSPHGTVVHGYSVAFGSKPGKTGAFLSLSETRIRKPRKRLGAPGTEQLPRSDGTPAGIALATHRSNFLLMGVRPVVDWIDWVRGAGELPLDREPVEFLRLQYAGRRYLASVVPFWPSPLPRWWFEEVLDHPWMWRRLPVRPSIQPTAAEPSLGWFVIEETAGERFLEALSAMIRGGAERAPERLDLPSFPPEGFGFGSEAAFRDRPYPEYRYALFRDGLALLGTPSRRPIIGLRAWSPKDGMIELEP